MDSKAASNLMNNPKPIIIRESITCFECDKRDSTSCIPYGDWRPAEAHTHHHIASQSHHNHTHHVSSLPRACQSAAPCEWLTWARRSKAYGSTSVLMSAQGSRLLSDMGDCMGERMNECVGSMCSRQTMSRQRAELVPQFPVVSLPVRTSFLSGSLWGQRGLFIFSQGPTNRNPTTHCLHGAGISNARARGREGEHIAHAASILFRFCLWGSASTASLA